MFRGSAYEFFRDDELNANSFFRKQSTDPQTRDNPAALDYNNFGYTLGGPVAQGQAVLLLVAGVAQDLARARRRVSASPRSGLADRSRRTRTTWRPRTAIPNAVRLLAAWPAPNLGADSFLHSLPNKQDTRQEVIRVRLADEQPTGA